MSAAIIKFPSEVRQDVAMARLVQKACSRFGWSLELREAVSIYRETKSAGIDPAMEAIARQVADELCIKS